MEFETELRGKTVLVYFELDGYKPLDVEAQDVETGEQVPLTRAEHDRLYEHACRMAFGA